MRTWKGVSNQGLPLWKAYTYKDASNNDAYVDDYEKYVSSGGDLSKLTETTTSDYNKAAVEFVGKSAIPDFVGGFGFDIQLHHFTLSTNFSYGVGGWGYDGVYANLMNSAAGLGATNYHKDIRNYWTKEKPTDQPVLATDQASALSYANSTSTRFLTSRSYLSLTKPQCTSAGTIFSFYLHVRAMLRCRAEMDLPPGVVTSLYRPSSQVSA